MYISSAAALSKPIPTTTLFVPVGILVVFVSTNVPLRYVNTFVPLLNVILYVFRLVYVAVIADDADVVVPSAVLTNTVVAVLLPACKNTLLCTDVISVQAVVAELSANHTEKYLPAQGDTNEAVNSISSVVISSHLRNTFAVAGFPPIRLYINPSEVKLYNHTSQAVAVHGFDSVALYALALSTSVVALLGRNTSYCLLKSPHTKA
jgi:hypothetical protein